MARRLRSAKITHISLVPKGANRMPVIYKADENVVDVALLMKEGDNFDEKGELVAVVYAPEVRDSQGDVADADVIKQMMYDSAKDGVAIDMKHDGRVLTKEQAYIAESFLVQKGDPRFDGMTDYSGNAVDPAGSWGVVIKINDPAIRKLYREGKWNGVSMFGGGLFEVEKSEDAIERLATAIEKALGGTAAASTGESTMKPEEIEAAITKSQKPLLDAVAALTTALTPLVKTAETKTEEKTKEVPAPVFKGDPADPNALVNFQKRLALHELRKECDLSTAAGVGEYLARLEGFKAEYGDIEPETPRFGQRAGSGLPVKKSDDDLIGDTLEKGDGEITKLGLGMGSFINGMRGYATANA